MSKKKLREDRDANRERRELDRIKAIKRKIRKKQRRAKTEMTTCINNSDWGVQDE
jgi:hypothetical protein